MRLRLSRVLTYVRLTQSPIAMLRLDLRPTRLIHFYSFFSLLFLDPFVIATVSYVLACAGLSASHAPAPTGFGRARELWRPNIVVWPPITLRVFFFSPLARVGHRTPGTGTPYVSKSRDLRVGQMFEPCCARRLQRPLARVGGPENFSNVCHALNCESNMVC